VALPAALGAEIEPAPSIPARSSGTRVKRVLVIDDDAQVARLFSRGLRDHDVTTADGGRAGVEACRLGDFDIVFCDLMMPDVTGPQLYAEVLELRPDLARRFVFMTGGAFTEGAAEFLAKSTRPLLAKPFTLPEVREMVERSPGTGDRSRDRKLPGSSPLR
jgi:two-component system cell cycle sensor histidine kinase/response regulator CckA